MQQLSIKLTSLATTTNFTFVRCFRLKILHVHFLLKLAKYYFFTRWGRVGSVGQMCPMGPTTKQTAISEYHKKIRAKSVSGDYRIV